MTRLLLAVSWRALKRPPLLLGVAATAVLVGSTTTLHDDGYALPVLRGAAILLASALVVVLDDPAADLLAASPTPLARRWAARLLAGVALPVVSWALALLWVGARSDGLPWLALSVEAAALAGLAVAVAAGLHRWRDVREPGAVCAPVVFGAVLAANLLPDRWTMLPHDPAAAGWAASHVRWAVLLAGAVVVVGAAAMDPARRRPVRG